MNNLVELRCFNFYSKDYLQNVIVGNINKTIDGPRVTNAELLRWLGLWFLISFVIGPSRPWPLENEYHSICCCQIGIMWTVELVEGRDCPQENHPKNL